MDVFRPAAIATVALVGLVWLSTVIDSRPALIATQELPRDVRALTDETWTGFSEAFAGRRSCLTDVRLTLVDEVPNGAARYLVDEALIEIEIPTSPVRYPESLAHELGHHLEAVCDVEVAIGDDFRRAQGLSASVDWSSGGEWEELPSEHFAESVVLVVLGDRPTHADRFVIRPDALELIERWAQAGPNS